MNTKVEAQGGELVIRNTHGDVVIIPRNKRREALGYLAKGDHRSIDAIAMKLPKASDYAMSGGVYDGGEDPVENPVEGVMGPETTIVGKRPFSVKNFLNRWGKHHAENPSDNFFGALGQGLMAPLQLAQAGATYALTGGKEIEPGAALRDSKFTNFMNKLSNIPTMDPISKTAASVLGSETGQNILLDPLNIPITKGAQTFSKIKPLGITENIGSDLIRNGDVENAIRIPRKTIRAIENVFNKIGMQKTFNRLENIGYELSTLPKKLSPSYQRYADKVIDATKAVNKVLDKTDDVIKNLPKLEKVPLDFNIEDVLKNISSTERKNMEIIKKGNAYFKELDNPESLKRLKEFGDEYNIDLLDAYKKAEKRWDYGNNIGKNDRFQVAGKEVFKDDIESALGLSTVTDDYFKMKMLKPKSKTLIPENKTEIDKYSINYVNKKASLKDYDTIIWHELSHDINKNIIGQSTKLQRDLSNIFVKNIDEVDKTKIESAFKSQKFDTYEKGLVKSKKEKMSLEDIAKDELAYVSKPTETWAFLSTNLRQDLKNTGIIKNYNELLTPEKLEQAIKNGNTTFSRFEPYIKDKETFIKLFNKMTLSIAPAALYLQSQQEKNN